jgi:HupE / UreJ protein
MKKYLCWLLFISCGSKIFAHPMPSSIVELYVLETHIQGEAEIPLIELGNAVGEQRTANLNDPFFNAYFETHIQANSAGDRWGTKINSITLVTDNDPSIGTYQEVIVRFTLEPANARDLHKFSFNYDAVIHQVVTHSALVYVREDWSNGISPISDAQQLGIIGLDIPSEKILPLEINLENGTWWKGFKNMVSLGMQHIKEGTDHLLFLIVLLLPAMLLTKGNKWAGYGGFRYSTAGLLKIVTAFTLGHSTTLLIGALGLVRFAGRPVEIMIAISILVSAIHALRPLFAGKEIFIAGGFGLIHGLAFASILSSLQLSAGKLALSIVGFNVGIEIMQLLIIIMIMPSLILLSKTPFYKWVRISVATAAAIAAIAWIIERSTGTPNFITGSVEGITRRGLWFIAGLAGFSGVAYMVFTSKMKRSLGLQNHHYQLKNLLYEK